jgi:hypothetical protein
MKKENEELLNRVAKEAAKEGLEFEESRDLGVFHEVIKRLVETPPAPKRERKKRRAR